MIEIRCSRGDRSSVCPEFRVAIMTSINITYRYCDDDTAIRPLPADSSAALLRLEQGNRSFAKLLDQDEKTGGIQQIIPVDLRDLGFAAGGLFDSRRGSGRPPL